MISNAATAKPVKYDVISIVHYVGCHFPGIARFNRATAGAIDAPENDAVGKLMRRARALREATVRQKFGSCKFDARTCNPPAGCRQADCVVSVTSTRSW